MTGGLTIEGCSLSFGVVDALRDVTIDVERGEFFTLVGPSGCGKTTTLRTVAGLESPDTGSVSIGGDDVTGVPPDERDVGIVFQNYALFPHMSVRENVAYGLQFRDPPGGASTGERVTEMLDLVDMAGFGDRDPEALSGGQQQRIALARALAPGPDVLLLDEPLSALDADLRQRLRVRIRAIQRDLSITTLYVTHDQAEAMVMCDRIAVMNDGRVEQVGTPEEVYEQPANGFVADFIGSSNRLPATVENGRLDLGHATVDAPAGTPDGDVTVVARPEAFELDGGSVEATIETRSYLGEHVRATARTPDGRELTLRFDPADAPEERDVTLALDPDRVHLLDEQSS